MAGLGRKTWSALEVVTAANVQGYLQDQVVQVYAGTAAAGSALGTAVSEGMVRYLSDSKEIHKYTGSSWEGIAPVSPNAVINGAFDIWQRGTSPSWTANNTTNYQADRWLAISAAGRTTTRQSSGLSDIRYCLRYQRTAGNTDTTAMDIYNILPTDDSIQFAGKSVTLSFYARKGANYSASSGSYIGFGIDSGTGTDQNYVFPGFTGGTSVASSTGVLTTSWQRFSVTGTVSSSATQLSVKILSGALSGTAGAADYYEITGVQLEVGSVATPFRRNANSIQGELAACQRYFQVVDSGAGFTTRSGNSTIADGTITLPVQMRTTPSATATAPLKLDNAGVANYTQSSAAIAVGGSANGQYFLTALSNFSGLPTPGVFLALRNDGGKIWLSSEL